MDILDKIVAMAETAVARAEDGLALAKGMVVTAQVLEAATADQVRLRIGSRIIQTLASEALEVGQDVKLLVAETSPRLVLTVLPGREQPGSTDQTLPQNRTARPASPDPGAKSPATTLRSTFLAQILDSSNPGQIRVKVLGPLENSGPLPGGRNKEEPLGLRPGRDLTARLLNPPAGGQTLSPGREVRLAVTQTWPRLVLELTEPPSTQSRPPLVQALTAFISAPNEWPRAIEGTRQGLASGLPAWPPEIRVNLDRLAALLGILSPSAAETPDGEFLPRLLRHLNPRGSVPPIKEELGRLWASLISHPEIERLKDDSAFRILIEAAARVGSAADQIQVLNREAWSQEQTLILPFPLFWSGSGEQGEIRLGQGKSSNRGQGEEPFRVALLLRLTRLGRIKVDVELKQKTVSGGIWAETHAARNAVRQGLSRLTSTLEARGLRVSNLTVNLFPLDRRPPDTLAEEMRPTREGLINLKV